MIAYASLLVARDAHPKACYGADVIDPDGHDIEAVRFDPSKTSAVR